MKIFWPIFMLVGFNPGFASWISLSEVFCPCFLYSSLWAVTIAASVLPA